MDNIYPQRCPACGTTGAINGEGELVCANCGQYGGQVAHNEPLICPKCGHDEAILVLGTGPLMCAVCLQDWEQPAHNGPIIVTADDPRVYVPPAIRIRTTLRRRGWNEYEIEGFLALVREFGEVLGDE